MYGFGGTILRINLETGEIRRSPTPESFAREWLGARGFVAKTIYDEVPRDADPLGPENLFIVAPGVLTGSFAPCGSKLGFGCVSPSRTATRTRTWAATWGRRSSTRATT